MRDLKNRIISSKTYLVTTILIFTALVIILGYIYLQAQTQRIKQQKFNEITAIAELKINQITQWFIERNSEAKFFSEDANYITNINKLLENDRDYGAEEYLTKGLSHIQNQHGYKDILIVDNNKKVIFSLEKNIIHVGMQTGEFIDSAFQKESLVFTDFYYSNSTKDYHLETITPVRNQHGEIVAAILFRFDPGKNIYPMIQSWPIPSETSEIVIVRQVKDSVEFINKLRHINNKPHSLKISIIQKDIPAVQAVLGYEGILEGVDYRGQKVISNVGPVPGTKWFMVVKIDKDEILSELYLGYIYISLFSLFLILFFAAGSSFVYSRRKSQIYKDLLEAQKEFKTTLNSIGEAVITVNNSRKIEYINPVAEELIGFKLNEVKGKNFDKVIKLVDSEKHKVYIDFEQYILNHHPKNESVNTIFIVSNDGKEIPVLITITQLNDDSGKMQGSVFIFRNLSKETEQKERLIHSEKRFSSLFQSIKDAILIADINRTIIDCNEGFSETFGYKLDEIKGKKIQLVYETEEQFYELGKAIKEHKGDKPFNYTVNYKRKDGSVFPGETGIFYLKDYMGNTTGFIGLIRDVSERINYEQEIQNWQQLLSYVIKHDPNSIAVFDNEMKYIFASNKYLNDYKITESDIIGKSHYEIFPEITEEWKQVHRKALSGERISKEDDPFERLDGNIDYVSWECRPWFDGNNKIGGIILYSEVVTKRKNIEKELRENEIRFRSIVEGAPDPIFIQTDMKFAYLNPAACKLFGIENPEQLLGTPVFERFHPQYYEKIRDRIKKLNIEKKSVEEFFEQKFLRVDGSEVWVETAGEPINYKGKNGALVFVRDVTQRKEAEKLRAEFFELLDKSLNEIYLFNSDNLQFVYANNGARKNLGYTLEELLVLTPIDIKPEFTNDEFIKLIEPLIAAEQEILVLETVHKRKDGSNYPVEIYLQLQKLEEKKLFLAIINDITQRKKNEKALRESEERWKFAIEGAGDGLWDWNVQTNEVYFSKNWKTMLGYDENEIKNDLSEWSKRVHKDDIIKANRDIKKHINGETDIYINEHRILCKDGTYKWILDRGIVMSRDENGNPIRIIGTHKDINKEKLTQIKMEEITELNKLAYKAAGLGIWRHNVISGEIFFDERAQKYYDVESEKISMNDLMMKIHPQDIEKLKTEMSRVINPNSDGRTTIEYRVIHSNGEAHWLQVNTRINFEGEGETRKPILGYGTVADITERKEAENNLRKLKDELALQVEAKTKELKERISELERFRDATIDRELRMKELREEIKRLKGES